MTTGLLVAGVPMVMQQRVDVVFVHGLTSSVDAWRAFTDLIGDDDELTDHVRLHCFPYDSPRIRLRPDRRIAEFDDIAERLGTWLETRCPDGTPVVLVSHSQGGLIVQRFLARRLWDAKGRELAGIKRVVMYACPNYGSGFLLFLRKILIPWRHAQERELRPLSSRMVLETQRTVLERVVAARETSDTQCPIPIHAYGGESDKIVPAETATNPFPLRGVVAGDHFSIIKPADRGADSYRVLKKALRDVITAHTVAQPPAASPDTPAPDDEPPIIEEYPYLPRPAAAPRPATDRADHDAAERSSENEGSSSVALPRGDGVLHGKERKDIVSSVVASGSDPEEPSVHILAGPGGSGKSRLALEIAYRAQALGRKVWWVRVNQLSSLMREVASELGIPDSQADTAWKGGRSQTDLVWRALNSTGQPWLIVFDNADEPQRLGPLDGAVKHGTGWLRPPENGDGLVVVTTRVRETDLWGSWARVHRVPLLDDNDGASMLIERAGRQAGTTEQARLLSHQLGGLPLALRTAATYIKRVRESGVTLGPTDIKDFASYGRAWARRFASPAGTRTDDSDESLGLEKIVDEVYGISLRLLERRGLSQAAPLLKAFACLNIAPIPYERLLADPFPTRSPLWTQFTVAQRRDVVMGLHDLELIRLDEHRSLLSLHPVVHGILRADKDVMRRRGDYYGLNARLLLNAVEGHDPDYPDAWPVWSMVMPHAIEVARSVLRADGPTSDRSVVSDAIELARLTTRYLVVAGLLGPARDLLLPIIGNCGDFGFDHDDREILGLRHEKGRIDLEGGQLAAAEVELSQVVERRRELFTDLDKDTLASRHKLARAILEQDRAAEAEDILRSVVEDERGVRGWEHADTMVVRHTLARAILAQGRAAEAEKLLSDILAVRQRKWERGTPETLHVQVTLARCLLELDRAREAVERIEEARKDARQDEKSHPVMRLRYSRAQALLLLGQVSEAEQELSNLLGDQREVLGDSHPEVRLTVNLLEQIRKNL